MGVNIPRLGIFLAALLTVSCASSPVSHSPPPLPVDPDGEWASWGARRLPLLEPCELPNVEETLLCGTIGVTENRRVESRRQISLNVVVVPAQAIDPPNDPVFVFEGGPGGAATRRAASLVWAGPVRQRDIVLVDQRGTGASNPLTCDVGGGRTVVGELREMFPAADVRSCAEELATRVDLNAYTTEHFADDIEDIRQQLGYGPINVRGGSYGTRSMMVFAQRHPESVRSLFGIAITSPLRPSLAERGLWSEKVLVGLGELCQTDGECTRVAPDLFRMVADLAASLDSGPRRVTLADPNDASLTMTLDVSRDWLMEHLRLILYYSWTSNALPWAVHRAHGEDDWEPLIQMAVVIQRMFRSNLSYGVLLTVQCSGHMGFDTAAALARGQGTLFGNYRLEQQIQGCESWPHQKHPTLGVVEPQALDVPTLFLSGGLDPVGPPGYAEDASRFFPNNVHIVLPHGQHGPFDSEASWLCIHQVWADFLDNGTEALDVSCTEKLTRQPVIASGEAFSEHLANVLAPMAE